MFIFLDIWSENNFFLKGSEEKCIFLEFWYYRSYGQKTILTNVLYPEKNVLSKQTLLFLNICISKNNFLKRSKETHLFLQFWYLQIYGPKMILKNVLYPKTFIFTKIWTKTIFSQWSQKTSFSSICWYLRIYGHKRFYRSDLTIT